MSRFWTSFTRSDRMKGRCTVLAVYVAMLCPLGVSVLRSLPRKTISSSELQQLTSMKTFFKDDRTTLTSFLIDEPSNRFYVGANNAFYVLNLTSVDQDPFMIEWNVTKSEHSSCVRKGKMKYKCYNYIRILEVWNETHLFACGTYAFDPQCAFIKVFGFVNTTESRIEGMTNGRGKCPFEPRQPFAATMAGGMLFAATPVDFQGKDPAVLKSMSQGEKIRTEDSVKWLSDPKFVASTFIRENKGSDDDDKLYFFFSETAREFEYYKTVRVPRVARVCKGDIGGQKTLQKKWTSFLKARLVCSDEGNEMYFDKIHDVFTLQFDPNDAESTVFYGVFSTRWDNQNVSAVCAYNITDVQKVFNGQYMEYKRESDKWEVFQGNVPDPRPGMCITNQLKKKGYNSTLDLPDNVLMFIRNHLLMAKSVRPIDGKPLFIMRDTLYSKITVKRQTTSHGMSYEVFYMGTESGHLHKALKIGSKVLVVEDYVIFKQDEKVLNIELQKEFVYIGSEKRMVQLPAVNCSRYSNCDACFLAMDPSCGWDVKKMKCVHEESKNVQRPPQNVEHYHQQVNILCKNGKDYPPLVAKVVPVVNGTTVFLPCNPSSAWSTCNWRTSNGNLVNSDNVGGIHVTAIQSSLGEYQCFCEEEGVRTLEAFYSLEFNSLQSSRDSTNSVNHLLMFVFLVLGFIIGVLVYKFCLPWCRTKLASKCGCKKDCIDAPQDTEVHGLSSSDEIRPLTIVEKNESDVNGSKEKEMVCENMEKEVNGMNVGPPRNQTISIISCQDETSI
ncbi:semaphorin-4F isoform X2 [Narcine bancroftii]|uniref:semaphorin-4F isoform X2 n=1 Tax=Narcine bancroftii TaxID=1343680 RepID=UPI0038312D87